jgi:hypothetical protein
VNFTVAGYPAGSATWHSGYFTELDLVAIISPPVGGIAEPPVIARNPAEEAGARAGGSGWSAGSYAALAGGAAAAAIVIAGGGWYVRRRWLR